MITVHHLNNSRSQRVLWLLEELGLPYDVRGYARDPKTLRAPDALRQIHPLGKAPIVTDGDRTIAETGAIFDYVLTHHAAGRLLPATEEDRLRHTYWMHFAEGSAMPPLVMALIFGEIPKRAPFPLSLAARMIAAAVHRSYLDPTIAAQLAFMEAELARTGWFAGPEITAADIMLSFPLEAAQSRAGLTAYPQLREFLTRIQARPAYRRALDRGGPYDYAP